MCCVMYYPLQRDTDRGEKEDRESESKKIKRKLFFFKSTYFRLSFLSVRTLSSYCLLPYSLRQDHSGRF